VGTVPEQLACNCDHGIYEFESLREFTEWLTDLTICKVKTVEKTNLKKGMVVQLNPEKVKNPMFSACMMVISEPKNWGAQGYVQALGKDNKPGGLAYYRADFEEMEFVGLTVWNTE
jgi:hypothetical protein